MTKEIINITEGSIVKQVIKLAWPAVSAMFLHTLLSITDAIWVGRLGTAQMAAVISSMFVLWILYSLIGIVGTGTIAVISRFYGARNFEKVSHCARQSIILTVALALFVTITGYFGADFFFKIMNTEADVAAYGTTYLQIIFGIAIFIWFEESFSAIFRASGDTKTPLLISSIAIGINLILDPIFIFGWGPIPALGVTGAAFATAIAYMFGVSLFFIAIKKDRLTFNFDWHKGFKPDYKMLLQISKIGLPLSTAGVVFSTAYLFMNRITAEFGTSAVAALGIGNRCESLSYLICYGFSIAVSTLVGQNLGAGKPDRAAKSVWYTIGISFSITLIISIAFIVIPEFISSIFIDDPDVHKIAVNYLLILSLSQVFMAFEIVLEGAFSGAGDTMPPMIVSIVGSIARLPIAYLLAFNFGLGVNGIWWAITSTTIIKGIILVFWFKRGKWKLKEVY